MRHDLAADLRLLRPRTRVCPFTQGVTWVSFVGRISMQTCRMRRLRTCYVPMHVMDRSPAGGKSRSEEQTACRSVGQACHP